jgi:hypothetical protein
MVRSEGVPAQWKNIPLETRQEMRAGFLSSHPHRSERWLTADVGEKYLRERFDPKCEQWEFAAEPERNPDGTTHCIVLTIFKKAGKELQRVLELREPISEFVSEDTLTKIILVVGHG